MKIAFLFLFSLLFSFSFIFAQDPQSGAAPGAEARNEVEKKIEAKIAGYLKSPANQALVVGYVIPEGNAILSFGKISPKNTQKPGEDALFELGQLSEIFVANLTTALGYEGLIVPEGALEDALPASVPVPKFREVVCTIPPKDPSDKEYNPYHQVMCYASFETPPGKITFCQLAAHNSGLPLWPSKFKPGKKDAFESYDEKKLYDFLSKYQLKETPGLYATYSHTGMALLSHAITLASGQPYESLLVKYLTEPMGLTDTRLSLLPRAAERQIPGHDRKGKMVQASAYQVFGPSYGMRSTPKDMMKFLQANIKPQSSPLKDVLEACQQERSQIERGPWKGGSTGYGWLITDLHPVGTATDASTQKVIWMEGQSGGFSCLIGFIKESGKGVFLLSNSANSVQKLGLEILSEL